jgi:hypothetical protein
VREGRERGGREREVELGLAMSQLGLINTLSTHSESKGLHDTETSRLLLNSSRNIFIFIFLKIQMAKNWI